SGALRSFGRALRRSGQGLLAFARCADILARCAEVSRPVIQELTFVYFLTVYAPGTYFTQFYV
ncbi:hypothetical protein A2U01_0119069, partial [Trifolium medium]|nr:hypothetical protein [Trifolium medium]